MINNMVPILNRSILISKVCNSDNMQTSSHIHVHMDIMECKVSPHSMLIDSLYRVHCQSIISSNEKMHNQFAIDNNYLQKYPDII